MSIWSLGEVITNESKPKTISFSGTGDNTVIAGVSGKTIRIWRMFFVLSAATNVQFWDGPSSSGTALTGVMNMTANGSFSLDLQGDPWFVTSSGNGFVINQSGSATIAGAVYYTQS